MSDGSLSTVAQQIERLSQVRPDHPAIMLPGFAPLSYRGLQSHTERIRLNLRTAGLGRRALIAVAFPSGPYAALLLVGVASSAVAVPVNPRNTIDEVESFFDILRPDAVLLLEGSNSAARRVADRKDILIIEATPVEGFFGIKLVAPNANTKAPSDEPDADAPAFILQTSGTTLEPKLIPFSHRNMVAAATRLWTWFNLTPQDRCLCVSPIYYSHGLKVTVFTPLLTGGTVVFPTDASKFDYSEWFEIFKPTWYSAGPALHRYIFDHLKVDPTANGKHTLRFVLSGGAPLPRAIREGLQQTLGVPVVEHYGSSEAAQISANLPPPNLSKPGTCGVPPPGTVMIVDENGLQVAPMEQGEILVRGPTVMPGYLNAPELNRMSFVGDWLKTGDMGSVDDQGFLTLHGRKKELINRGGEKIWPDEIDSALMRHPAVAEAASFPVPHPRLGEDVLAAVVLHRGMKATSQDLRTYLSAHLALFKLPRRIIIVHELPKGLTGKVLRWKLSEDLAMDATARSPDASGSDNDALSLRNSWKSGNDC